MEDDFRSWVCIPGAVFVVMFSLMAVVLNSLLLIVLYKDPTKSLRSTTALYITSLAVLHFLFGSVAGTAAAESYIACALGAEDSPYLENQFSRTCFTCLIRAENFLVLAFAVERLGNTAFPVFHRSGADKVKYALICFACISLYALGFSIFEIFAVESWIRRLDVHLNITIPLVATVTLSALLHKAVRKLNILRTDNGACSCPLQAKRSHTTKLKKQIPLANAFIFIALLFFVSLVPFFLLALCGVYCSNCWQRKWFFASLRFCVAMVFLNAGCTPFIYYICVPEFRKGFKIVFCGIHEEQPLRLTPVSRNHHNSDTRGTVTVIYL